MEEEKLKKVRKALKKNEKEEKGIVSPPFEVAKDEGPSKRSRIHEIKRGLKIFR